MDISSESETIEKKLLIRESSAHSDTKLDFAVHEEDRIVFLQKSGVTCILAKVPFLLDPSKLYYLKKSYYK
jgi:hypothetical protein